MLPKHTFQQVSYTFAAKLPQLAAESHIQAKMSAGVCVESHTTAQEEKAIWPWVARFRGYIPHQVVFLKEIATQPEKQSQ